MNQLNQTTVIKNCIDKYLEKGMDDKTEIYSKVVEELGVPRPTVRRIARDLRNDLLDKIRILQHEAPGRPGTPQAKKTRY